MVLGITPILSVLRNFIEIAGFIILFLILDKPRLPWRKTIFFYGIFLICHTAVGAVWVQLHPRSYGRLCIISLIVQSAPFCFWMSRYGIFQVLYNISLQISVLLLQIFISVRFALLFFDGSPWADLVLRVMSLGFVITVYLCYFRRFYQEMADHLRTFWKGICAASLCGDLLIIYFGMYPVHVMVREPKEQTVTIAAVLLFFATHLAILRTLLVSQREMDSRDELEIQMRSNELLRREITVTKESMEDILSLYDDICRHCQTLDSFAKEGNMEGILSYLHEYEKEEERKRPDWFCSNCVVDSILTAYERKARKKGISVQIDAAVKRNIGIRDVDLTAILGNLLENAIQGAMAAEAVERVISLSVKERASKFVIVISNTSTNSILFKDGLPQAQRKTGIGISSILKSAARYGGETDFCLQDGMFICRMLLKLPTEPVNPT
ncbi:ATP-binding protein [Lachnospiraceae bacterium JLR.KK008]